MQNNIIFYSIISCIGVSLLLYMIFIYIRSKYRAYDLKESIKEEIELLKLKIKGADSYFFSHYNTDFDSSIYRNIKPKIDFCTKLIDKESLEEQKKHYNELFNMLYETNIRIMKSYDNVSFIVAPMNNLYRKLAQEHIDYIKKNSMDEEGNDF